MTRAAPLRRLGAMGPLGVACGRLCWRLIPYVAFVVWNSPRTLTTSSHWRMAGQTTLTIYRCCAIVATVEKLLFRTVDGVVAEERVNAVGIAFRAVVFCIYLPRGFESHRPRNLKMWRKSYGHRGAKTETDDA